MSKRIYILAAILGLGLTFTAADSFAQGIDSTAKKVGNKAASTAVKGVSAIKDKIYKGKQGPNGQVVYIDNKDRKYYVDDKGKKVFLKPSQIKNKPEE
ncbi:hypothetical protein EGT74_12155 [Chitinophaga lutea]|uniref:PBCV-specific basic adaptor domain-containing protein n=1 Tax=Chitinophaga lutea TaxID=2488634 RepID=A0A3N4Q4R5_9BACT|nr:hypothetical protein [Chitinophaga lutea]RPE14219.1 hypothetical protein EGT74_12155 [Chitinophaga lutea]